MTDLATPRALDYRESLTESLRTMRLAWLPLLGVAAIGAAITALTLGAASWLGSRDGLWPIPLAVALSLVYVFALCWSVAAGFRVVSEASSGMEARPLVAYRSTVSAAVSVLFVWFLLGTVVFIVAAIVLVVPIVGGVLAGAVLLAGATYALPVVPVIVNEGKSALDAVGRSMELLRGRVFHAVLRVIPAFAAIIGVALLSSFAAGDAGDTVESATSEPATEVIGLSGITADHSALEIIRAVAASFLSDLMITVILVATLTVLYRDLKARAASWE